MATPISTCPVIAGHSSVGKFKVILASIADPNLMKPRNPRSVYMTITVIIAIMRILGNPRNCWGFFIEFSTGMTAPIPSIANITVLQEELKSNQLKVSNDLKPCIPEEDRPFCVRDNGRLITNVQFGVKNVIQHNTESHQDESISTTRKRHQILQVTNLTDEQARYNHKNNVNSHTKLPSQKVIADVMECVGNKDNVDASS